MKDKMKEKFLEFLHGIGVTEEEYSNLSEEDLQASIPNALKAWLGEEYLNKDTCTWSDYTLAKFKESPFYHACFGSMVSLGLMVVGSSKHIQVVKFVDLDRYYKRTGYTGSSHGDIEWDLSWHLTVPRERLITEYP
jgi:hypothetical protein